MTDILAGRIAIVTGAGSGIGRACAQDLSAQGATVVCVDIDFEAASATASGIGSRALPARVDVTIRADVFALVDSVRERHGRLDILANVAGAVTSRGPVRDMTEADFDTGLALNLKSLVYGCQAAARAMTRGGSIVNISSGTVDAAVPNLAAYSIPKGAITQLTRTLAQELGPHGIRVNSVSPGYIETAITRSHYVDEYGQIDEQKRRAILDAQSPAIPLGRPGEPSEVASVVTFLAGDGGSYVSGQTIRVNGGSVMPL